MPYFVLPAPLPLLLQAEDPERLRHQLAELAKENHLLKRAVAIQNARIQVGAALC